jgi:hypothetical protein
VSRLRRRRFKSLTSLWPLAVVALLLAASAGCFWWLGGHARFERVPLRKEIAGRK